jgi:threonyl-tRNA synthetase
MAVVGMKEMESGTLAIRSRKLGDLGSFTIDDLMAELARCTDAATEMTLMGKQVEGVVEVESSTE